MVSNSSENLNSVMGIKGKIYFQKLFFLIFFYSETYNQQSYDIKLNFCFTIKKIIILLKDM